MKKSSDWTRNIGPIQSPGPEHHVIADMAKRIAQLEARLAEAEKVIKPFCALAAEVFREGMNSRRKDDDGLWGFDRVTLTYGHLRAARDWLEKSA